MLTGTPIYKLGENGALLVEFNLEKVELHTGRAKFCPSVYVLQDFWTLIV
jgi:hypothetical protein